MSEHLLSQFKFLDFELLGEECLDFVPQFLLDLILLLVQLRCLVLLLLQLPRSLFPLLLGTGVRFLIHLALGLLTAGLHLDSLDILLDRGDDLV